MKDGSTSSTGTAKAGLIFPGGGLFFYWQAGVIVSKLLLIFRIDASINVSSFCVPMKLRTAGIPPGKLL
jgi:hypothetical protein